MRRTRDSQVIDFLAGARKVEAGSLAPHLYHHEGRERHPPHLPRGGQPGFHGGRRAADSGADEVGIRAGQGARRRRRLPGDRSDARLQRGQARAHGDRNRPERGLGQLRGRGTGPRDLRLAGGQEGADHRRGKDVRTGGPLPAPVRRGPDLRHQPHARPRRRNGGAVRGLGGRVQPLHRQRCPRSTSSSPPAAPRTTSCSRRR